MKINELPTNDALRSSACYGTVEFPIACYEDVPGEYRSQCIDWHWHYEVEFALVTEGSIICNVGTELIRLSCGDGIFLNTNILHRYDTHDSGRMFTTIFAPELIAGKQTLQFRKFIAPILERGPEYRIFSKNKKDDTDFLFLLENLTRETLHEEDALQIQISASLLWRELFKLLGCNSKPSSDRNQIAKARVQLMIYYIMNNYSEHISLQNIAASAGISKSEALRCFRSVLQTTPVHFLNEFRLGKARDLLQTTTDSVNLISYATGFEDASYFCNIFKKYYKMTPKAYRKTYGG